MKNDWPTAITLGIAFIAIFSLVRCNSGKGGDSTSVDESSMAHIQCKEFVRDQLKAPSSADFAFLDYSASNLGGNQFVIRSTVEAQNSFGVKLKNNYVCSVKWNGLNSSYIRNWELLSLQFIN